MITDILEKYYNELIKKYESGITYLESDKFENLNTEKQRIIENKFNELIKEINNTLEVIKPLKESSFKESNYKIKFELTLQK